MNAQLTGVINHHQMASFKIPALNLNDPSMGNHQTKWGMFQQIRKN